MLKWALIAATAVAAVVIAALAALPWLLDTRAVNAYVAHVAGQSLGRPVTYGSLSLSGFPVPSVKLKRLQIAEDPAFGSVPFLTVEEGRIRIRLRPLISRRIELSELTLDGPRISLVQDATGRLNVGTLGPAASPATVSPRVGAVKPGGETAAAPTLFSSLRIVNGSVRYSQLGQRDPALDLENVNINVTQGAAGEALQLSGEAVAQPGDVRVVIREATAAPTGSVGDATVKAMMDVEARDIAPIAARFMPTPAVSGPVTGRLELAGTLAHAAATGALTLPRVAVSEDRPQCGEPARRQIVIQSVRVPLSATRGHVESAPVTATVAGGTLSLLATVSLASPAVAAFTDIAIKGMELGPVLVDFLCEPYAVTGPLDLSGDARLRLADIGRSLDGGGRLRIGPGKVVGRAIRGLLREVIGLGSSAVSSMRPDRPPGRSPLDFDSITASYTISAGVVRTDDLVYQARDVRVRAAGTYAVADGRVAMELTLSQGPNQLKAIVSGAPGSLRVVPTGVKLQDTRDVKKFLDRLFR